MPNHGLCGGITGVSLIRARIPAVDALADNICRILTFRSLECLTLLRSAKGHTMAAFLPLCVLFSFGGLEHY